MANRQQRRQANSHKNGFANMLDGVKEKLDEAKKEAEAKQGNTSGDEFVMPMPDYQDLRETEIVWTWESANARVKANFHKPSKKYGVLIDDVTKVQGLTAIDAKELGQILCAAYQWEHMWESHAGVYLANDGMLPVREPVWDNSDQEGEMGSE